ncbi:MAG: two-component system activity regulator YycH [Solibacillus sp.]|uniref:YycH family regulatory protein n=1 Tax=Solibacillus sp. TaxID=1909654 RepID=UPI003315DFB5
MKYIEQIKSILLTFLVLLSLVLTLLIWNYKPDYELIEETQIDEVLVGEQKELKDVLKPYRLLFHDEGQFYGTVSTNVINQLYDHLMTLNTGDVDLINSNISDVKMNEMIRTNNRVTLFFNDEIPLHVFKDILPITDSDLPDGNFTRLIIDYANIDSKNQVQLLFLNTEKKILFGAVAELDDPNLFKEEFITSVTDFSPYMEVERDMRRSLYIAQNPIETIQYRYFIDTMGPLDKYKDILFSDPNIVQHNVENLQSERYTDGTSLMTADTQNRILNYVYPPAESVAPIPSARLLKDSFDFINEHGGFTEDYRYSSMNVKKHNIKYQLFLQGYPIYSKMTTTHIVTTWGENRLFRYRRPYYTIESDITSIHTIKELASGEKTIEHIRSMEDYSLDEIDEIVVGYYLMQDQNQDEEQIQDRDVFLLEPSWFIISNDDWTRISPDKLGGSENGLE